jgi:hypothetical protein
LRTSTRAATTSWASTTTSTTHGFRLTPKGGVIEVAAHDLKDKETLDAIRTHLEHISKMFAEGDFEAPMLIHGQILPASTS